MGNQRCPKVGNLPPVYPASGSGSVKFRITANDFIRVFGGFLQKKSGFFGIVLAVRIKLQYMIQAKFCRLFQTFGNSPALARIFIQADKRTFRYFSGPFRKAGCGFTVIPVIDQNYRQAKT
jgi:hypothetical protein